MPSLHPWFEALPPRYAVGHRGAAGHAPENTLVSFEKAVEFGVKVLEMDVHLTADRQLVVIHDQTLERTTNGVGRVRDRTMDELRRLDAGYRFTPDGGQTYPWRGRDVRLSTLDEVADTYPDHSFVLEIKPGDPVMGEAVAAFCNARNQPHRFLVGSFYDTVMRVFRRSAPAYATGAGRAETKRFVFRAWFRSSARQPLPFEALIIPRTHRGLRVATKRVIQEAQEAGLQVHVWTVNLPSDIQTLFRHGANGITSDYPDRTMSILREGV